MKQFFTAREIYEQKIFYWVKSYKTVLTYMDKYSDILDPTVKGKRSGKRYFVSYTNISKFLRKFEDSKL